MIKRSTTYQTIVGAPPSNNGQQIFRAFENNICIYQLIQPAENTWTTCVLVTSRTSSGLWRILQFMLTQNLVGLPNNLLLWLVSLREWTLMLLKNKYCSITVPSCVVITTQLLLFKVRDINGTLQWFQSLYWLFLKIYIVFVHLTLLHKYKQGTSLVPTATSVGLKVPGHHICIGKPQVVYEERNASYFNLPLPKPS